MMVRFVTMVVFNTIVKWCECYIIGLIEVFITEQSIHMPKVGLTFKNYNYKSFLQFI